MDIEKELELEAVCVKVKNELEVKALKEEIEKLENLNIFDHNLKADDVEEVITKYTFKYDHIVSYIQTFVFYKNKAEDAIICTYIYKNEVFDTPALLIKYTDFKQKIKENEQNNSEST